MRNFFLVGMLLLGWLPLASSQEQPSLALLFSYLQDPDIQVRERAIRQLVKHGPRIIPQLQRQLQKTGNPIYLRVIAKIQQTQPVAVSSPAQLTAPQIRNYLQRHLQRAQRLFAQGHQEQALQILQAILILEPHTSLRQQILQLQQQYNGLQLRLTTQRQVYVFGSQPKLQVRLQHNNPHQPSLTIHLASLILRIFSNEFSPTGLRHSRSRTMQLPLNCVVQLEYGQTWQHDVQLTLRPPINTFCYRQIRLELTLPPLRVEYDGQVHYQRCSCPVVQLALVPSGYEDITAPLRTLQVTLNGPAISPGQVRSLAYHCFIASFFLQPDEQKQAIPLLIEHLGRKGECWDQVLLAILHRMTGRNFGADPQHWRNWWRAQN